MSVSNCPEAWIKIAQLGGLPIWRLTKDGGTFLDAYGIQQNPGLWAQLTTWGVNTGWITLETIWKVETPDEEHGDIRFTCHFSRQEAEAECDVDGTLVAQSDYPVMTDKLAQFCNQTSRQIIPTPSFLLIAYAHRIDIDGVWWNDELDECGLSAPRGGILPHKLHTWKKSRGQQLR